MDEVTCRETQKGEWVSSRGTRVLRAPVNMRGHPGLAEGTVRAPGRGFPKTLTAEASGIILTPLPPGTGGAGVYAAQKPGLLHVMLE